jgi:hypothetical protein
MGMDRPHGMVGAVAVPSTLVSLVHYGWRVVVSIHFTFDTHQCVRLRLYGGVLYNPGASR